MKNFKSFKQKIKSFCLIFFVVIFSFSSSAYVGWYRDGNKMAYLTSDGYRVANTWRDSDGMKFFLDETGYVVYNKVFNHDGRIYYVGPNGARVTNSFVIVTEDMILGDDVKPGYFYFSEDGSAYMKNDVNFIKNIEGKKFAFDELGHVVADCWLTKDGDVLESNDDIIHEGKYHAKADGSLCQNEWYNFVYDVGSDQDMGTSTLIADDYDEMNGLWMYFDNKATKVASTEDGFKRLTLNGREYSFDSNGIMLMGFQKNRTEIDTSQQSNPTLKDRIKFYDKNEGGLIKNQWLYDAVPEAFSEEDHSDGKEYWYYVDNSGVIVKNKIKNVGGVKYSFDGLGRLRKGFILVAGTAFMGAEYKAEDLTRDDFIYSVAEGGHLYGSDLLDIHYFNEIEDSKAEGRMLTGDVKIELGDGIYDFRFRENGIAVGNKNELKLHKRNYYRNGIKYVPWEGTRYGIVKVSDDEYKVLNASGNIVKGKRKLIKDDYDNYIIILNDRLAAYVLEPERKGKIQWKTFNNITGYYFYDMDLEKKAYTDLIVASGTTCPTPEQIDNIPTDLRINFK